MPGTPAGRRQSAVSGAIALVVALGLLLVVVRLLAHPLALLLLAVVFANAVAPVVTWLTHWLPRSISVVLVYAVVVLVLTGAGWYFVPRLVGQALAQRVRPLPRTPAPARPTVHRYVHRYTPGYTPTFTSTSTFRL